jgi:hypothetical protein
LGTNCLIKQAIEGKIEGRTEVRVDEEEVRSSWITVRKIEDAGN